MDLRLPLLLAFALFASVYAGVNECYECNDRSSNVFCRDNSNIVSCGTDEYCQTVITKDGDQVSYSKGCRDADTCLDEEYDNHRYCDYGIVKTNCKYCSDEELGNEEIPYYHEAFDGCGPWSDWSNCRHCYRHRVRNCGEKSKSGSKGSGSRHRREDEDEGEEEIEIIHAEREIFRSKRGSKSGSGSKKSGSREITEEVDNCCVNSCSVCDSFELELLTLAGGLTGFTSLLDAVISYCPVEECDSNEPFCETVITYSPASNPFIAKQCISADTCRDYQSRTGWHEFCPRSVDSWAELFLVASNLMLTPVTCSYCCDNGVDEYGNICNSRLIIPDAEDLSDNASTSVASLLATVVMVVLARIFGI